MTKEQLENALIGILFGSKEGKIYTEQEIDDTIEQFASLKFYSGISREEIEQIKRDIHSKQLIKLDIGTVLVDTKHKKWFVGVKPELEMKYWNRYKNYLQYDKKFAPKVIDSMDDVSDEIVDLLGNPMSTDAFQRRGLVVGDVQSGKTANYISVINKASDAGYKIIVLLTGTIEKLRKQTQIRVDEGFIGKSSDNSQNIVGVGKYDNTIVPLFFTTIYDDFKSTSTKLLGISLDNMTNTCVLVVKKNVSVLKNLNQWIKNQNLRGGSSVVDNSILVIDDEADNASINTNDEDKSPTKINEQIRILLNLFTKTSYLGFTATPYANIFIDPFVKAQEMLADDLFPRDYIYCLDAPTNYIGARNIFGTNAQHSYMIQEITDAEEYFPQSHKIDFCIDDLSPSLETALYEFYLANVIRDLRGDVTSHRSMLINISRFVNVQRQIGEVVNRHLKTVKDDIRLYSKLSTAEALKNSSIRNLKRVYEEQYSDIQYTWDEVQNNLIRAIDPIQVFVVNSGQNELDYESNETYGLRAICVGGLTLSRGLTLEGLVISYFYRNSKIYDTLMQMGRWFGYRGGYEDICRIWMSEDSINWYSEISDATDELRRDIKEMKQNGGTPRDFGLRVKRDSNILMITARNKMRSAAPIPLIISLSGEFIETPKLYNNFSINATNYEVLMDFVEKIKLSHSIVNNENSSTNFGFTNIPKEEILNLLGKFDVSRANIKYNKESIISFISNYAGIELKEWDIVFLNGSSTEETETVMIDNNHTINWMSRTYELKNNDKLIQISGKRNRLGTASDASFGLTKLEVENLKKEFIKYNGGQDGTMGEKWYFSSHVKGRRPLIMVYFVGLKPSNDDSKLDLNLKTIPLIGLSIGIPTLTDQQTKYVTYMLNVIEQQNYMDYNNEFGDENYE